MVECQRHAAVSFTSAPTGAPPPVPFFPAFVGTNDASGLGLSPTTSLPRCLPLPLIDRGFPPLSPIPLPTEGFDFFFPELTLNRCFFFCNAPCELSGVGAHFTYLADRAAQRVSVEPSLNLVKASRGVLSGRSSTPPLCPSVEL